MSQQLELILPARRAAPRTLPVIERLYGVLHRQGISTERRGGVPRSHLFRPCLGGPPDWSIPTDERGVPATGSYELLCGWYSCQTHDPVRYGYSERDFSRQTRRAAC